MRVNDSLEMKIIRIALPLIIYWGVTLLVQVAFGIFAMVEEFISIGESSSATYILAYRFLDNTNEYIGRHTLLVTFIAALVTILILSVIIRKEGTEIVFREDKDLSPFKILGILLLGIFVSTGVGKLVNLVNIDNIIGSNEAVNDTFLSNPLVFQILTLCIAAPIVEELVFRGMIYNRLKQYTDTVVAVFVSAGIFGIYHGNLVQGIYAAVLGILLCFVYERCKSFVAPVLLHMVANSTALITLYLPISKYIGHNPFLNVVVMLFELAGMCAAVYLIYKNERKRIDLKI